MRWDRLLGPDSERLKYEIDRCAELIRLLSHDELQCIRNIAKIVRFDLLTVLLYLDILLSEIESYAEPWTQKTLLRLGTKARIEVLRQSLLDLTKAQEQDSHEVRRVVQSVKEILRGRSTDLVLSQRGLVSFLHGGLYQVERDILKPVSDGRPND